MKGKEGDTRFPFFIDDGDAFLLLLERRKMHYKLGRHTDHIILTAQYKSTREHLLNCW